MFSLCNHYKITSVNNYYYKLFLTNTFITRIKDTAHSIPEMQESLISEAKRGDMLPYLKCVLSSMTYLCAVVSSVWNEMYKLHQLECVIHCFTAIACCCLLCSFLQLPRI